MQKHVYKKKGSNKNRIQYKCPKDGEIKWSDKKRKAQNDSFLANSPNDTYFNSVKVLGIRALITYNPVKTVSVRGLMSHSTRVEHLLSLVALNKIRIKIPDTSIENIYGLHNVITELEKHISGVGAKKIMEIIAKAVKRLLW